MQNTCLSRWKRYLCNYSTQLIFILLSKPENEMMIPRYSRKLSKCGSWCIRGGSFPWCNKAQSRIVYRTSRYIDVFHVRMTFQVVRLFCFFLKTGALRNPRISVWQDLLWWTSLSFYTHAKLQSILTLIAIRSSHVAILQNIISQSIGLIHK